MTIIPLEHEIMRQDSKCAKKENSEKYEDYSFDCQPVDVASEPRVGVV